MKKNPWSNETTEITLWDIYVLHMISSGIKDNALNFFKVADTIIRTRDKIIKLNKKKDRKEMI